MVWLGFAVGWVKVGIVFGLVWLALAEGGVWVFGCLGVFQWVGERMFARSA